MLTKDNFMGASSLLGSMFCGGEWISSEVVFTYWSKYIQQAFLHFHCVLLLHPGRFCSLENDEEVNYLTVNETLLKYKWTGTVFPLTEKYPLEAK